VGLNPPFCSFSPAKSPLPLFLFFNHLFQIAQRLTILQVSSSSTACLLTQIQFEQKM
jgi:hypothetical protein